MKGWLLCFDPPILDEDVLFVLKFVTRVTTPELIQLSAFISVGILLTRWQFEIESMQNSITIDDEILKFQ